MKSKILIMAITVMNIGMIMNSYADDQKQVNVTDQKKSSSFFSPLSEHKAQTAIAITGLAIVCFVINLLSDHNLQATDLRNAGYDIYAINHKNPLFILASTATLGVGMIWGALNETAPKKSDNFVETTN